MQCPRVRSYDRHEVALPTWTAAQAEDWLGRWAMNLMLINVSTRKLRRAVRLPEGDLPVIAGDGTSKSAASRRFVALSAERLAEWMASIRYWVRRIIDVMARLTEAGCELRYTLPQGLRLRSALCASHPT